MRKVSSAVGYGAIGGVMSASCMTVVRMGAHRLGLIQETVPQAVTEWAEGKSGVELARGRAGQQATNQILHLGYGLLWGALYGFLFGQKPPAILPKGLAFGFALWVFGFFGLGPLLKATQPAWRAGPAEQAVNVAAHLVYGVVTALLTEELARQPRHGPAREAERQARRVG